MKAILAFLRLRRSRRLSALLIRLSILRSISMIIIFAAARSRRLAIAAVRPIILSVPILIAIAFLLSARARADNRRSLFEHSGRRLGAPYTVS